MMNPEDLNSRRTRTQDSITSQDIKQTKENKTETRQQLQNDCLSSETLTNTIYTPAFLKTQIGKLMKIEFLIGTNNIIEKIGILEDAGVSYILLRSLECDSMVYADIHAIKFITISTTYTNMPNFQNFNNNMNVQGINSGNGANAIFNRCF